jgi:hypothetical protein
MEQFKFDVHPLTSSRALQGAERAAGTVLSINTVHRKYVQNSRWLYPGLLIYQGSQCGYEFPASTPLRHIEDYTTVVILMQNK